ncbi:TonB-dependent receptor [Sphingomonas gilva]|uniref:TonB-dependent receptor n=1 Tax=Sphingomonas gilva TaxID=2305907 RepID=A0A396RMP9_9SPHN|nr:TonB-dependent receptor [Sphingomonas gilva]RHW16956.1 TonB-dependent receptor [Sphingomonas gilva]
MNTPLTLGTLLLLSTALTSPAWGQTPPPSSSTPGGTTAVQELPGQPAAEVPAQDGGQDELEVSIPGGGSDQPDIVVRGRYIPDVVRSTPEIVAVLSSADIARTGEGDIAGALQRVTGLSVVGNGFVYVRGLGDRYSLALLNGSPLPSPEPLKRVVPLDIFPTSVLGSALVQKSYSANYPGEFGGGVINLTTKAIPTESFLTIGGGVGGDSETTFELGYTHYGSDTDWLGYDDGTRSPQGAFERALESGMSITPGNFTTEELQAVTASLANSPTTVAQTNRNIPANFSTDISAGTAMDIGDDARVGVIAAAGFSNSWRTRDAIQQVTGGFSGDELNPDVDFRSVRTDNRITLNGLLGVGIEFGEQTIRWTNLYIHDTLKQTRIGLGIDGLSVDDTRQVALQNTAWYERQLIDTQLVGEFEFGDLGVDVRGTYANSQREAPYERSFSYVFDETAGDFVNNLEGPGQSATVSFSDLNEDVWAGGVDLTYKFAPLAMSLSAGYAYSDTERTSVRRDFRYLTDGDLGLAVAQQRPDYLLSDFNVYTYNILLNEISGQAGNAAYDAGLRVHAGYAQLEADFGSGVSATAGVRYEDGRQFVTPVDLLGAGVGGIEPTLIENDYWLPAATITWNFAEDMQLRLNASKTIARPQFRELAFQVYQDTESDRQFFGNPFLVDSELFNAEARYEWYFGRGERLSLAGFYKKIDRPIEAFAFRQSSSLQTSFANAPQADLYGAELEVVKYVPLDSMGGDFFAPRRLVLIGNYTYSKSELKVGEGDEVIFSSGQVFAASNLFRDGAPLTGQSEHLANLQIGLENTDRVSQQTFLLTYASERVTNRGPFGNPQEPDIIERPGLRLDFVAREEVPAFGTTLGFKFEVRNITGEDYEEFQEAGSSRIDVNTYDVGTSVALGVEVKF